MIHDEKGMLGISGLIVLCVLSMLMYYLHDLYLQEAQIISVLQKNTVARNFTVSEVSKLVTAYKQNETLWEKDCTEATKRYDLANGVLIDTEQMNWEQFKIAINAYLVHYQDDMYILIAESTVDDVTNQVCVYLMKKDDGFSVERWER